MIRRGGDRHVPASFIDTSSKKSEKFDETVYICIFAYWNFNFLLEIWTSTEDEVLKNLVQQHGTKDCNNAYILENLNTPLNHFNLLGLLIAESLSGRTGKQCRERWHNHLDCGIKKGDWTEEVLVCKYSYYFSFNWSPLL